MFADISLNHFKRIEIGTGDILSYENKTTIIFYIVNKGPVVFRTIIKKDKQDKFKLFMQQFKSTIPLFKPLK